MTGDDLLRALSELPADVRARHLEIGVETLPRETFTVVEVGLPDESDIAYSRDCEMTAICLLLYVRA